jgi:pimeloyl-ACP methyl ester carboxylesterase
MSRHPERVRGAVLMNMQALTRDLFEANANPIDLDLTAEWLSDPAWSRRFITPDDHARADWWFASTIKTDLPRYHNHALVPNLRPGAAVFLVLNRAWDDDYDFTVGLERLAPEVLLLGGEDDEVLGHAFQQEQVRFFPRARLEPVAACGHNDVFTTRRDETNALVREYLDALPPEVLP